MEEKDGTIYIWTNLINGKQYIGQTTRALKERIYEHKKSNGSSIINAAIKKYGIENFKIISFSCPEKDLDWTESFLEAKLNTIVPNGYNLQPGGSKYKHHHEITRQKMRDNHPDQSGKNHPMFGRVGEKNPRFGKHHTKEVKQKLSKARRDENNPAAQPAILISPEGIEYKLLCYYPFCREHGLSGGNICQVLQGKRKHHKGWTGKYLEK
jgi:group I intron endonuclease